MRRCGCGYVLESEFMSHLLPTSIISVFVVCFLSSVIQNWALLNDADSVTSKIMAAPWALR